MTKNGKEWEFTGWEVVKEPINLKLKGLALNSIGGERVIQFYYKREREEEIIKALDSIGIKIEVRNYGR